MNEYKAIRWAKDCLRKSRYRSEDQAKKIARDCKEKRKVELRVYYCTRCLGFHLTSKI